MDLLRAYTQNVATPVTLAIAIILIASIFRKGEARREDFVTARGFAIFGTFAKELQTLLIRIFPVTLDPALLRIDHALGFDPVYFAKWAVTQPALMRICIVSYVMLPPVMAMAWVGEQNLALRRSVLMGGILIWFFYASIPAVGPAYYNFQTHVASRAPRNCLPSMHLGWAILIAWNTENQLVRPLLWLYEGLIAVATIALGEHYLIDLIAAVPYTFAIQWISQKVSVHERIRSATAARWGGDRDAEALRPGVVD